MIDSNRFRLVGKIKGLSEETKRLKKKPFHKIDRYGTDTGLILTQSILNGIRIDTRYHLLTYAFLRNVLSGTVPYCKIEKTCRIKPSADKIAKMLLAYSPFTHMVRGHNCTYPSPVWRQEKHLDQLTEEVSKWLAGAE